MINQSEINLGYYQVGDKIFTDKIAALVEGTEKNIHPQWIFNNNVFDAIDWTIEPEKNIQALYAERAQRIRDSHDYMILSYSGGSDSENILQTCLKNNIRIDEIFVSWALSASKGYVANSIDYNPTNQLSEWELNIKPKLEKLSQEHPEIKITIYDWTEKFQQYKINDDYVMSRNINYSPYSGLRWDYKNMPSIDTALTRYQNPIVVHGTCKPRICWTEGNYYLYFIDQVGSGSVDKGNKQYTEYFYWHPDSWELLVKQAQLVVKFFNANPGFKQFIAWPTPTPRAREFYETAIRAIIYPDLDLNFFQGSKFPDFNIGWDSALFRAGDETKQAIHRITHENYHHLRKVIDPKYFQNVGTDRVVGFISGMYRLQKSTN